MILTEFLQEIRDREDDIERRSSQSRKSDKIRRAFETKKNPNENDIPSEEPQPMHQINNNLRLPRHVGYEIQEK